MSDFSKLNGYDVKDAQARSSISEIERSLNDFEDRIIDRVDTLGNSVETLDNNVSDLNTTVGGLNTTVDGLNSDISNLESDVYSINGKRIQIFGDSMTDPNLLANNWPSFLTQRGAIVTNRSVSGKRISGSNGYANDVDSLTGEYDINIVFCGVNDSSNNVEIGDKYSNDNNTFCGAVDHLFSKIVEKWPNAINYVILPVKTEFERGYNVGELKLYNFILYRYAMKYNFLVMDLYRNAPMLNPHVATYKTLYQSDGLHPTALYQPILAKTIIKYLEHQKSDSMGSELIDVSNCFTGGATTSYRDLKVELSTDKIITFHYYGTYGNNQISSNKINLGQFKSFLKSISMLPLSSLIYGSNNARVKIDSNEANLYAEIFDSPSGDVTVIVNGSWFGFFLP